MDPGAGRPSHEANSTAPVQIVSLGNSYDDQAVGVTELAEVGNCPPEHVRELARGLGLKPIDQEFEILLLPFAPLILEELGLTGSEIRNWISRQESRTESAHPSFFPTEPRGEPFELPPEEPSTLRRFGYQYHLLTAREKADYYADMLQNGGQENRAKVIEDCLKKIKVLRQRHGELKKAGELNEDEERCLLEEVHDLEEQIEMRQGDRRDWEGEALFDFSLPIKRLRALVAFWSQFDCLHELWRFFLAQSSPLEDVRLEEIWCALGATDSLALERLRGQTYDRAWLLLRHARAGNGAAALEFAKLVTQLVRVLNLFAKLHVQVFRSAGRQMTQWPVLVSHHHKLADNSRAILDHIQLGADHLYQVVPEAEWDPNEYGGKVADLLIHHLTKVRQEPQKYSFLPYAKAAQELPGLGESGSANQWWAVAKQALLSSVPKPELHDKLRALTQIRDRFKVRDKILNCLERRFVSRFPKTARR